MKISKMFFLSLLFVGLFGVNVYGQADPDVKVANVVKARANLAVAQKSLKQEGFETDAEFEERRSFIAQSDNPAAKALRVAAEELKWNVFSVPSSKVTVTISPFDREAKAWTLQLTSKDPSVPFKGTVIYSIAKAENLKVAFDTLDKAIKAKTVVVSIDYLIQEYLETSFRVFQLSWNLWSSVNDGEPLTTDRLTGSWTFSGTARTKPEELPFMPMINVAGGNYNLQSSNEGIVQESTLSNFCIGVTEVTQSQWRTVMGKNPSYFKNADNWNMLPVEMVTWFDVVAFCNALSQIEGLTLAYTIEGTEVTLNSKSTGYRLPTETQWEYAARGGSAYSNNELIYCGSNNLEDVAWYEYNSRESPQTMGTKKPNSLGLYDMSGNVWEWCSDWYGEYPILTVTDSLGPASGTGRVLRGGSWCDIADSCTAAFRGNVAPEGRYHNIGFRVVRP